MLDRTRAAALLAAGVAAVCVTGTTVAPAFAATPVQVGLFGSQDPTYDGVYRQGLTLIALQASGVTPDAAAVAWLTGQQCADGSFTAFRADPSTPCADGSGDSNATAMAIQALAALGRPATAALSALRGFQLADGGYYSNTAFGAPASDANSTGLAMSALTASGADPNAAAPSGKTPVDWLLADQVGCNASSGQGAFDFQPESPLAANDYATVQAALGLAAGALPVSPRTQQADAPLPCPSGTAWTDEQGAAAAAAYLAGRLQANHGVIPSSFGSGTDWTTTANAVLYLVHVGLGGDATAQAVCQLAGNVDGYVQSTGSDAPGPLATLILVAHATGKDPRNFSAATACAAGSQAATAHAAAAGADLVGRLLALETKAPTATPTGTPTASPTATPTSAPTAAPGTPAAQAAPAAAGTLPRTGDDSGWLATLGGLCLALGVVLVLVAVAGGRRRSAGDAG